MKAFYPVLALVLLASCGPGKHLASQEPETPRHEHQANHTPDTGAKPSPGLPTYTKQVAAADKPGILSGVGKLFSTPEGIARRQAVRLAKASVPRKLGKAAVYAPAATQVQTAYKPKAPVVNADSGASVQVAVGKKAPVIAGDGNTVPTTNEYGLSYWWLLAIPVGLAVAYRKRLFPTVFACLLLFCSCSRQPSPTKWEALPGTLTRAQLDSLSQYNY